MYDSLKKKGIDKRNSDARKLAILKECCDDYNNSSWEPYSIKFPELHSKLSVSMCLSLLDTAKEMLPEMAMKIIKDMQALFKKGHIGWTASGNGKMAEGTGNDSMKLLIKGTTYDQGKQDMDEGEIVIKYCDDDRFKFCDSDLGTTYFWGYVEMIGLTTFSMQNIGKLGLAGGVGSALTSTAVTAVRTESSHRKEQRSAIQKAIVDLPSMMEKSMKLFMNKDTELKKLNNAEEHYRRSLALYNIAYVSLLFCVFITR
jgi:hypothetical protein